jgi:hypothetical protein
VSLFLKISFRKIGLKESSGNISGLGTVMTLEDAIKEMGDVGKKISYLKVFKSVTNDKQLQKN